MCIESLENVLNIESKFHKIGNGIAHDPSNSTKERLKWANFEVRRFTYKLGTVNKQLRKAKAKWNMMYNSFSVDKTVLLEVSKNKRDLCKKLEIFRRLRRNLLRYIKGLKCESDPKIPFIPPKYRSAKVPAYLYSEGVVGIPKKAYRKKPKDTSTVKSIEKANTIDKNDPKSIEKEVMRIIADAKGQAVYKNKLVDKSIVKYRGL
ncbi:conserved hypothetical protein [Theileria equi strain WA]|uniref:Uncharacterized protein n=1 Tax=Theileria equi strain WA TaxID=1537102 RepID=L1LGC7_THEEQ|nr:conserved hypothetical protein [Theileria equi strain WA]EKX74295.1 conserved hypothetical protein [Theileria equi strain WA]|eukprot:XP_004833747.1 conserved hypothetical protein [Theileria equi strain WA]